MNLLPAVRFVSSKVNRSTVWCRVELDLFCVIHNNAAPFLTNAVLLTQSLWASASYRCIYRDLYIHENDTRKCDRKKTRSVWLQRDNRNTLIWQLQNLRRSHRVVAMPCPVLFIPVTSVENSKTAFTTWLVLFAVEMQNDDLCVPLPVRYLYRAPV